MATLRRFLAVRPVRERMRPTGPARLPARVTVPRPENSKPHPRQDLLTAGSVVPAIPVVPAANDETTATMAVTRLISDAFCVSVSCHQVNPMPKDRVADIRAVTVPATATGCLLVCGHR